MLIDTDITIAYKCFSCGTFDFININLFKLSLRENIVSDCKCGKAKLKLQVLGKAGYRFTVPCIGCGSRHSHVASREKLLNNKITIYTCPETGIKNCFIGKDQAVREFIDGFEKELDGMIDGLGYDSYFENTQVMLDTLNKIHDIAEQGKLHCECGCKNVTVSMLRKGIALKCSSCTRGKFIPAASNNDLKKTLQMDQIVLVAKKSACRYQTKA